MAARWPPVKHAADPSGLGIALEIGVVHQPADLPLRLDMLGCMPQARCVSSDSNSTTAARPPSRPRSLCARSSRAFLMQSLCPGDGGAAAHCFSLLLRIEG